MSDQEQKPDGQDAVDDLMAEASEEVAQAAENTQEGEVSDEQAPAESSEQTQDDQSTEDTAEGAENQAEQEEEPTSVEGWMEKRSNDLNTLLDSRERTLLSYVDQEAIHIEYYKSWREDANHTFKLRVLLERRKKRLKKSA